jgi:hypothetical protein
VGYVLTARRGVVSAYTRRVLSVFCGLVKQCHGRQVLLAAPHVHRRRVPFPLLTAGLIPLGEDLIAAFLMLAGHVDLDGT